MFIAYQYGLRGLSIRAMLPFCLVWLFLVGLPLREYLRKKISTLKAVIGDNAHIFSCRTFSFFKKEAVFQKYITAIKANIHRTV